MVIVIMGVAGSGKTTIGQALAAQLKWPFRDADEFHPPANVAKMSAGIPLNDDDRAPWLAAIRSYIDETLAAKKNAIVTCSALKEIYRKILNASHDTNTTSADAVRWVYLKGNATLLAERLSHRRGHFMKTGMLQSQLETLEEPRDAVVCEIRESPETIVRQIREKLGV
ncbi:MAG TPA: gluconokinase [Opitutaceae bacterium]